MNEDQLFDAIRRAAKSKEKRINVSLAGVSFMSSGMISMFLKGKELAKSLGVDMGFVNASPNVVEVFEITKLNRHFRIEGENE